jgi:hypothetical protein
MQFAIGTITLLLEKLERGGACFSLPSGFDAPRGEA